MGTGVINVKTKERDQSRTLQIMAGGRRRVPPLHRRNLRALLGVSFLSYPCVGVYRDEKHEKRVRESERELFKIQAWFNLGSMVRTTTIWAAPDSADRGRQRDTSPTPHAR